MLDVVTTIVVLSHNARHITEKFIDLLFANTEHFNLIMIDNGSTDGTVEYLNKTLSVTGLPNFDSRIVTLVINKENLGVIGGRNIGFELFNSHPTDYLCFLDNDQFVQKDWLNQYLKFMSEGNYDLAGADAWFMDNQFMPRRNCKNKGEPYTYVGCGGMLMKRKVAEDLVGFDEQFNPAYFEDPDFNFRARQNGYKVGWNSEAKIIHLPHQTLGKNANRMKIFADSYQKFKNKWNTTKMLPLR